MHAVCLGALIDPGDCKYFDPSWVGYCDSYMRSGQNNRAATPELRCCYPPAKSKPRFSYAVAPVSCLLAPFIFLAFRQEPALSKLRIILSSSILPSSPHINQRSQSSLHSLQPPQPCPPSPPAVTPPHPAPPPCPPATAPPCKNTPSSSSASPSSLPWSPAAFF